MWEKYRAKSRKQRPASSNTEIVTGCQVCMKNSPMYQAGAIGAVFNNDNILRHHLSFSMLMRSL